MLKVFLVDDEIVIREGIRNNFPWDEVGCTLCGEAPDGEMALPMMLELKPDVLITDIRMPFMDGLALAEQVAGTMPWVHTVILSGHDDFSYARQAISLGVKEYLLKPVSAQQLETVLRRIAENIGREHRAHADMQMLRRQLASSVLYAQSQLLGRLLEGGDAEACLAQAKQMRLSLQAPRYLVMLLGEAPEAQRLPLQGALQRLTDGYATRAYQTTAAGRLALVILGESDRDIEERAYGLAQALAHEAAQDGLNAPSVAIGAPVADIRRLPQALSSAMGVLCSMQGQPRRIVGSTDIQLSVDLVEGDMASLHERMRYASLEEAPAVVAESFAQLGHMAEQSLLVMHYMLVDMLVAASRIIKQGGGSPAQVLPQRLLRQGELLRVCEHPQDVMDAGVEIATAALSFRDRHAFSRYGEILRKACAYIEENYHRPEMTLHDVASHVALSNNHFCTVFSQEMGKTFIGYLTDLRMDKARTLLLTTGIRSSELAAAVGYNDPHYFSYLFKKHVGLSPRMFRKEGRETP